MSDKLTILQILPELNSGGVERGTVDMARAIAQAQARSLVVSAGGTLVERLERTGAKHITMPVASKNPWRMKENANILAQIIEKFQVNLVHARSRAPAWSAYLAAKRTNTPFVTTFHGVYNRAGLGKQRYNSVMTRGEKVIAVSHYVADHMMEYYGVEAERIRVIHRGVDMERFHPERVVQGVLRQLIQEWRLEEVDVPVLFMPGRFTRWKGQHVVLQALAQMPHRNFFCIFAGEAGRHKKYYAELKAMTHRLKLSRNVLFAPATAYMPEAYMVSDCVLCPSVAPEAFGRIPIEAQAMGKPVIATSHGGACETILGDQTGWLVPPDRVGALTQAIEHVISLDRDALDEVAYYGRMHVHEHFSLEAMVNKTLDVYEEVLRAR